MPSASKTLSTAEITAVARAAGFGKDADTLATAVAVALAESSGRTNAVSPTGCCHGLWQINVNVHPYTKAQMRDPAQNAAAAWKISNGGTNWKPWSAYNNGAYFFYLASARSESRVPTANDDGRDPSIATDNFGGVADDFMDGIEGITYPLSATKEWLSDRNNIFRIAKVLMGGAIVVLGLKLIVKQPIQTVIKEIKK